MTVLGFKGWCSSGDRATRSEKVCGWRSIVVAARASAGCDDMSSDGTSQSRIPIPRSWQWRLVFIFIRESSKSWPQGSVRNYTLVVPPLSTLDLFKVFFHHARVQKLQNGIPSTLKFGVVSVAVGGVHHFSGSSYAVERDAKVAGEGVFGAFSTCQLGQKLLAGCKSD